MAKKLPKRQLDVARIERAIDRVQIPILSLRRVMEEGLRSIDSGMDDAQLRAHLVAFIGGLS